MPERRQPRESGGPEGRSERPAMGRGQPRPAKSANITCEPYHAMPLGDRSREAVGKLPATVRALGWTSFLTDLSGEAIYPLLPNFVKGLGGSAIDIGLLDGIASAVAAVVGLFAGERWWPACSPSP